MLFVLAVLEPLTLAVLLGNLFVLHHPSVAQVVGPVHGACYLGIIVLALLLDGLPLRRRLLALVPGIGGLLVDRTARRVGRPGATRADQS